MGKLDAVTESSAGCENGIPQAHRTHMHGQVNSHRGGHFGRKNSMNLEGRAILPAGGLSRAE